MYPYRQQGNLLWSHHHSKVSELRHNVDESYIQLEVNAFHVKDIPFHHTPDGMSLNNVASFSKGSLRDSLGHAVAHMEVYLFQCIVLRRISSPVSLRFLFGSNFPIRLMANVLWGMGKRCHTSLTSLPVASRRDLSEDRNIPSSAVAFSGMKHVRPFEK